MTLLPSLPYEVRFNVLVHGDLPVLDNYCLMSKSVREHEGPGLYASFLWQRLKLRVNVAAITNEAAQHESDAGRITDIVIMRIRFIFIKETYRLKQLTAAIDEFQIEAALALMRFDDGRPEFNINFVSPHCRMTLLDWTMEVGFDSPVWTDSDSNSNSNSDSDEDEWLPRIQTRLQLIKQLLELGARPGKHAIELFILMLDLYATCLTTLEARVCMQIIDLLKRHGAEVIWPDYQLQKLDSPSSIVGSMLLARADVIRARNVKQASFTSSQ